MKSEMILKVKKFKENLETSPAELKILIKKGKNEGHIAMEEISDALSELDLDQDQIENIFKEFDRLDIDVVDEKENDLITQLQKKPEDESSKSKKLDI